MKTLVAGASSLNLPEGVALLDNVQPETRDTILTAMPGLDRWDHLGEGEASRKDNPFRPRLIDESDGDTAGTEGSSLGDGARAWLS